LTAELIAQLKKGLKLQVGGRPFGSSKLLIIDVSLKGFTRAFSRLKTHETQDSCETQDSWDIFATNAQICVIHVTYRFSNRGEYRRLSAR
jgi:hypothetical protein